MIQIYLTNQNLPQSYFFEYVYPICNRVSINRIYAQRIEMVEGCIRILFWIFFNYFIKGYIRYTYIMYNYTTPLSTSQVI